MKVYIAGAISKNENYLEQFDEAEKSILKAGDIPLNPVKHFGFDYKDYIDMGLCELMRCDAVYMLKGYEESEGALLELKYAQTVGMEIIYQRS
ncbi:DUF4406 domain-containing protein [Thomasclavelia cocleata]|uniref:DUF4406 domain-containing protein n=1 Tax=Thomasclavelia cocleata TaxID=69824 RepID=UPI00257123AE|nr:DUF4406 domain-containing protein [Thomasclavelia cocleata]